MGAGEGIVSNPNSEQRPHPDRSLDSIGTKRRDLTFMARQVFACQRGPVIREKTHAQPKKFLEIPHGFLIFTSYAHHAPLRGGSAPYTALRKHQMCGWHGGAEGDARCAGQAADSESGPFA